MNLKRIGIATAGGGVAAVCAASVAWACTYQPHMATANLDNGRPNTAVTVAGQVGTPNSPVEIRWNGEAGPLLGTSVTDSGGNFSQVVTIPADATPDVYFLMGVVNHTAIARTAFEVTAPAAAQGESAPARAAQGDVWSGYATSTTDPLRGASVATTADGGMSPAIPVGVGLVAATALGGTVFMIGTLRRRRVAVEESQR